MTPGQFWASTVAQLAALLPEPAPDTRTNEGTGADLMALAQM